MRPAWYAGSNMDPVSEEEGRRATIEACRIHPSIARKFSPSAVAAELARIGYSDLKDFIDVLPSGEIKIKPFDQLTAKKSRIIKRIKQRVITRTEGRGEDAVPVTETQTEFELHDKLQALINGAKLADLFPAEKQDQRHSGSIKIEVINYAEDKGP